MAHFDTGLDILGYVLRRAGDLVPSLASTTANVALADHDIDARLYINQAYFDLCAERRWAWARKQPAYQFVTEDAFEVTVTGVAGNVISLSGVIINPKSNWKFMFDSEAIPHRIASHVGGSHQLFLVTPYAGEATTGTGRVFRDEYTLPVDDILAFPDLRDIETANYTRIIPEEELRERFPRNTWSVTWSSHQYAAFIDTNTLRFAPWHECRHLYELSYNYRPDPLDFTGATATDTPIAPREHRHLIAELTLERLYSDKEDARLGEVTRQLTISRARIRGAQVSLQRPRMYAPDGKRVSG